MTPPIVPRLRDERVSTQVMAQTHGTEAHGTLLLLVAMPCLLPVPVPGVGTVLGLGLTVLSASMWRGHRATCLPQRAAD